MEPTPNNTVSPQDFYSPTNQGNNLFSKKNIVYLLLLAVIILAIPVGLKLVREQQILKSQAAPEGEINLVETENVKCEGNTCTTAVKDIEVKIKAP